MLNPVRQTAGWLAGRLLLFVIVLVILVLNIDPAQFGQAFKILVDQVEATARLRTLESAQANARASFDKKQHEIEQRLKSRFDALRPSSAQSTIEARIEELQTEKRALESTLLKPAQLTAALLGGPGLDVELENRIRLQILNYEIEEWVRALQIVQDASITIGALDKDLKSAERAMQDAGNAEIEAYNEHVRHWNSRFPLLPNERNAWNDRAMALKRRDDELRTVYRLKKQAYEAKVAALRIAQQGRIVVPPLPHGATETIAEELDAAIARLKTVVATMKAIDTKIKTAFWIVVGVTLSPILVRALWFWIFAPWAARRPLRFDSRPYPTPDLSKRISGVSLDVVLKEGEELLVHPEYLQSSTTASSTRTKWLLSWRFPMASVATRMIGLTLIRGAAGKSFTVSSRTDPFSEVGLIEIPPNAAFILQPRFLVGLVQRTDRPIAIGRYWRFGLAAWITLQFRYLAFEGPGTLIVQGCRGVRLEPADSRRAVDQRATLGFSANLEYAPSRAETFAPYLLGMRGLFNDGFRGRGVCAYEEMPYARGKAGITGRGLEGLTDAVMKVFGY